MFLFRPSPDIVLCFLAGLPPSSIETAARSMEEVYYKKGDKIIEQDDIGDSFFVLEEGFVSVTVSVTQQQLSVCRVLTIQSSFAL